MHNRQGSTALVLAVISLVLAGGGPAAFAQSAIDLPANVPGSKEPPVPVLDLAPAAAIKNGKAAAVKGTVDGAGLRFAVGKLSILQPVVITLFAGAPADDLRLTLFKKDWKQPRRAGSTGTRGSVAFTFRTEGAVNILVQSSGPMKPFYLIAWAGDEIHPSSMKDVIVTPAQFKGGAQAAGATATATGRNGAVLPATTSGGQSSHLGWFVAGGLGVAVLVLGVLVLRRKRK
jgi:hypothetical protein